MCFDQSVHDFASELNDNLKSITDQLQGLEVLEFGLDLKRAPSITPQMTKLEDTKEYNPILEDIDIAKIEVQSVQDVPVPDIEIT